MKIVAGHRTGAVKVVFAKERRIRHEPGDSDFSREVTSLAWTGEGEDVEASFTSGRRDGTVAAWDTDSVAQTRSFSFSSPVAFVAFFPPGALGQTPHALLVVGTDGRCVIVRWESECPTDDWDISALDFRAVAAPRNPEAKRPRVEADDNPPEELPPWCIAAFALPGPLGCAAVRGALLAVGGRQTNGRVVDLKRHIADAERRAGGIFV
eukprot:Polyplicarium_translucidae@DN1834_c0_g1_i2.p3